MIKNTHDERERNVTKTLWLVGWFGFFGDDGESGGDVIYKYDELRTDDMT